MNEKRKKEEFSRKKALSIPMFISPMFFSVLILLFTGMGYGAESAEAPSSKKREAELSKQVALVNGSPITVKMVLQSVEERLPSTGHRTVSRDRMREFQREELDKLVIRELLVQEAGRLGIKADSKEIEKELQKIRDRFRGTQEFEASLNRSGLTLSEVRRGLETHLLVRKFVAREIRDKIKIGPEEMKNYYGENMEQFVFPDAVRMRQILIKVDPGGRRQDWEAAKEKGEGIVSEALEGADFGDLARLYSEDETASKGGDSGLLHRGMIALEEVEKAAFSLEAGQVSHPIRTLYGYMVIKVEEKVSGKQLKFSEVNKQLLEREMRNSTRRKLLNKIIGTLRAEADIQIF